MSLSLKIRTVTQDSDQTKIMKFPETMSIGEAIQQIRDKTGIGGADFGIFQPKGKSKQSKSRWLKNDKSFMFYEIESETVLEYKKKHRLLKVKLLDDTQKVILVDDGYTVTEMVTYIGEKMGLRNVEEFSLTVDGAPEGEWLHPQQTLHEQNVSNEAVIVLKKKFFVSDANIDTDNPLTLHYLYLQAQSQIMADQHPLTLEEALAFAALQCQIHFGNYDPDKHKVGFLKGRLKDFLSPQHLKVKDAEPGIYKIYRKFVGMNETNAKMRFVQLCRSLKTYGITYFQARESPPASGKQTKKPKLVLLGVTRDSFIRMEPETKEVISTHPLKHIRRWAATKNNFTLDVGDYADSYMHFTTPDAEKISQLLAGYIDIILKKTRDTVHLVEDDSSLVATEEEIGVVRSAALATMTSSLNFNQNANSGGTPGSTSTTYKGPGYSNAAVTKLVIANKNTATQALGTLIDALSGSLSDALIPQTQNGPQRSSELLSEYAAALTGVAIPLLDVGRIEGEAAKLPLDQISKQVGIQASKLVDTAVLSSAGTSYGGNMIDAAKKVCQAMKDLISFADMLAINPNDEVAKQAIQRATQLFKVAKVQLQVAPTGKLIDRPSQQILTSTASSLAFSVDDLLKAVNEEAIEDPKLKGTIAKCTETAEEVVQAISFYAPLLAQAEYRNYITDPVKALSTSLQSIDIQNLPISIKTALGNVGQALSEINAATSTAVTESSLEKPKQLAEASKGITMATARLLSSVGMGDTALVSSSTDALKGAVDTLLVAGKASAAATTDKQTAQSMLAAVDTVQDNLKAVVYAANIAAEDPSNDSKQATLLMATQKLSAASQKLVGNAEKQAAREHLRGASKSVIASSIPLTLAAKTAAKSPSNPNPDLLRYAQAANEAIMNLIESLSTDEKDKDSPDRLLNAVSKASVSVSSLVAVAQSTAPGIAEFATRNALQTHADATSRYLNDLVEATKVIAEANGGVELEQALQQLSAVDAALDASIVSLHACTCKSLKEISSSSGQLKGGPGQTEENSGQMLNLAVKSFSTTAEKLVAVARNAGSQSQVTALGSAAKSLAQGASQVVNCSSTFAATIPNKEVQQKVLKSTKSLMNGVSALVAASKAVASNPTDDVLGKMLQTASTEVSDNITKVIGSIKSSNDPIGKECDAATESIEADLIRLTPNAFSSGEFATFAEEVENCNKALQAAISQILDVSQNKPHELGVAAQTTAGIIGTLINVANQAAATCKKDEDKYNVIDSTKKLSHAILRMIGASKAVALNREDVEMRSELKKHSKQVADTLEGLENALNRAVPGIKLLDSALQDISRAQQSTATITDIPKSSGSMVEMLTSAAKSLASFTSKIVSNARVSPEQAGNAAIAAAEALAKIMAVSKSSENTGVGASALPENMKDFIEPSKKIEDAIKVIAESEGKPTNVINSVKSIAAATSELVANTKSVATTLKDPTSQQKLLKAAQSMAEPSQKLVTCAKAVASKAPNSHAPLVQAARELQNIVNGVVNTAAAVLPTSNAGSGMKMDDKSQLDNVSAAARNLATSTSALFSAAKVVSVKPKDSNAHFELSKAAKAVSDSIQTLLNSAQGLAPEQIKCDEAVEKIATSMENLDAALLSVTVGGLEVRKDKDHQQAKEELIQDSLGLSASIAKLVNSALNKNSKEIGETVLETSEKVNAVVNQCSLAAATTSEVKSQKQLLELAKIVSESVLDLLNVIKSGEQIQMADKAKESSDAIKNLVSTLKLGVVGARDCDEAAKAIITSAKSLDVPSESIPRSYKLCKEDLSNANKALFTATQHLVSSVKTNVSELGPGSRAVAETISRVVAASRNAVAASGSATAKEAVTSSAKTVAGAAREVLINSKVLATDSSNATSQKKLALSQKALQDAVEHLMNSLSTGEIDCEDAIDDIRKINSGLDTASLFASAGQLEAEEKVATLEESQQQLHAAAKSIETITAKLLDVSQNPETLGQCSKEMSAAVKKLASFAKTTAAMLPDPGAQQKLIGGAKNCSVAAQQTLSVAKDAQSEDTQVLEALKNAVASTNDTLQSLFKSAESILAEATIGDKKINAAKAEMLRMLDKFAESDFFGNQTATVQEVVDSAKMVATSTARLISACSKTQDELIEAAKTTAKEANQLLNNMKGVLRLTKDSGTKKAIPEAVTATVKAMSNLFDSVKNQGGKMNSVIGQQRVSDASEKVADAIAEVIGSIAKLPGADKAIVEDNIEEKAEEELFSAAKAIESAAAAMEKIAQSRKAKAEEGQLEVTDAILESARAITTATSSLIHIAVDIQKSVLTKEKASNKKLNKFYRKDSIFAEGLMSAAKAVSATTQQLVKNANAAAQGSMEEEGLIAAAKAVGAATAQLVSASKVKSPENPAQPKLQEAAKAVASATSTLVSSATAAAERRDEEDREKRMDKYTNSIVAEMEQQMKILKLEKELEKARAQMKLLRTQGYTS